MPQRSVSAVAGASPATPPALSLAERVRAVRARSLALIAPLSPEDCVAQSMPDASPAKWHLAHTTWFFEQFVLGSLPGYRVFDASFGYLFNSYYESVGARHQRPQRGLLTRPSLERVLQFREHVDEALFKLLEREMSAAQSAVVELGLQHEQQHQELLLMDIKHLFSCNPLQPAYAPPITSHAAVSTGDSFVGFPEGIYEIGHRGDGFCFDNETPRHRVFLQSFQLASRPVTNGQYLEFMRDRGYARPELWLADGWSRMRAHELTRPLYWSEELDAEFTLGGLQPLDPDAPVCHVSLYEADAFAHWAGARLPAEAEWEVAAARESVQGNFAESGALHPQPGSAQASRLQQLYGDVWEWTASAYSPYPGFKPLAGALGEYNGKFMSNQMVMRGGACVTPQSHLRATYRNFFYPHMRWQFSGIRLAKDLAP